MFKRIFITLLVIIFTFLGLAGLTKLGFIENYFGISYLNSISMEENNIVEENIKPTIEEGIGNIDSEEESVNNVYNEKEVFIETTTTNNNIATVKREKLNTGYIILNDKIIAGDKSNSGVDIAGEEDDNINLTHEEDYANIDTPNYKTPIFVHEDFLSNYNIDDYDSTISVNEDFLDREYTSNLGDDIQVRVDLDELEKEAQEEYLDTEKIKIFNTEKDIKDGEAITGLGILR